MIGIEQYYLDARFGGDISNARAHHARTQNTNFFGDRALKAIRTRLTFFDTV